MLPRSGQLLSLMHAGNDTFFITMNPLLFLHAPNIHHTRSCKILPKLSLLILEDLQIGKNRKAYFQDVKFA